MNTDAYSPSKGPTENTDFSSDVFVLLMGFLASLLSILILVGLVRSHQDSHHIGVTPWVISVVFLPTVFIAIRALRRGRSRFLAVSALLAAVGGMAYLYYLDHTGELISYLDYIYRLKGEQ